MFGKILIANRGEIACRVIATARRMGVSTVAVFSDADAGARHVDMADESFHIGPAPAAESYLSAEKIIAAARKAGAEAIHPGYGFLSENPDFAEAVEDAGLIFIGPPASAIRAMGLKDAAKRAMEKAGVPVVPGYHGENQGAEFLSGEAERIGYPVLIKARAGGGGKGMRLMEAPKEFTAALEGAQREAMASFGDPACLIEKYIVCPRHIEIQVFGDGHGNIVHLFERDCSLQRRHQKVIEEAPAPGMTEEVREAMGRAAVEAARAIGYRGAGTVEFIVDGSNGLRTDGFWFMEMNTRLQVEHPVTEAITGLDLVELQLRVALGEPLPFAQDDLAINGHAIEARIYAEDVAAGFLPATGKLDYLEFPEGAKFAPGPVRIDAGVAQGDAISPYYDPMIAKLIVHGRTRREALNGLAAALGRCRIAGAVTNVAFLGALARHDGFTRGDVDTGLIARDREMLLANEPPPEEANALAALAALGLLADPDRNDPWASLQGWRHWRQAELYAQLDNEGKRLDCAVSLLGDRRYRIETGGRELDIEAVPLEGCEARFSCGGSTRRGAIFVKGGEITVFLDGRSHVYRVPDPLDGATEAEAGGDAVAAPMPGLVKEVRVEAGQDVSRGDALMILEAMKMEHTLSAPRDGRIAEVFAAEGDQVGGGALLLTLETENADG